MRSTVFKHEQLWNTLGTLPPPRIKNCCLTSKTRAEWSISWKLVILFPSNSWQVFENIEKVFYLLICSQDHRDMKAVSLDVRADGYKQILRITNYDPDQSLYKPKSRSSTFSRQDTFSSAEAFEAVTEQVTVSLSISIDLGGIGLSLVNKKMVEILYATLDNLKFEYTDSSMAQAINLSLGHLQIDNQLHDALYPVILQPTSIPKDTNGVGALPTIQVSVIWLKDQGRS